jgi:hypothetical protein
MPTYEDRSSRGKHKSLSLRENLQDFKIPNAGMEAIRSKLAMEILDEYANIWRPVFEREEALSALRNMILKNHRKAKEYSRIYYLL